LEGNGGKMENKPEKKFRAGAVTATIWRNVSEKGSYGTVQLERSYMDKDNNWKSTGSFRLNDLPKASLVLQKAYEYLAIKSEADDGSA
jgi:hypothetical protein